MSSAVHYTAQKKREKVCSAAPKTFLYSICWAIASVISVNLLRVIPAWQFPNDSTNVMAPKTAAELPLTLSPTLSMRSLHLHHNVSIIACSIENQPFTLYSDLYTLQQSLHFTAVFTLYNSLYTLQQSLLSIRYMAAEYLFTS